MSDGTCQVCKGKGFINTTVGACTCGACEGTGKVKWHKVATPTPTEKYAEGKIIGQPWQEVLVDRFLAGESLHALATDYDCTFDDAARYVCEYFNELIDRTSDTPTGDIEHVLDSVDAILKGYCTDGDEALVKLRAHIASLQAENAKLQQDRKRLEWLMERSAEGVGCLGGVGYYYICATVDIPTKDDCYPSPRQAIDKAMEDPA